MSLAALRPTPAQVYDFKADRPQTIELHGLWRFHIGDDPDGNLGWADPAFDDSDWKLLRITVLKIRRLVPELASATTYGSAISLN